MRVNKIASVATSALLLMSSMSTYAEPEKIIKVSTWGSPNHGINKVVWPTWGQWIEEATEGRVTLKVEYDLAPPHTQIDVVTDGIGDVTWIFHGLMDRVNLSLKNQYTRSVTLKVRRFASAVGLSRPWRKT